MLPATFLVTKGAEFSVSLRFLAATAAIGSIGDVNISKLSKQALRPLNLRIERRGNESFIISPGCPGCRRRLLPKVFLVG
jgi:hypothetical protein